MRRMPGLAGCILILLLAPPEAAADNWMRRGVPNGGRFGCGLCHFTQPGGGGVLGASSFPLNGFGDDVRLWLRPSNYLKWSRSLANIDSDSDGYTNGEELQELTGSWRADPNTNDPLADFPYFTAVGNLSNVRNPGDGDLSIPRVRFETIEPDTVNVGDRVSLTLTGSTTALGREIVFEFPDSSPPPEGAEIVGNTFTWRPAFEQGGTNRIPIRMTDGTQEILQSFIATVLGGAIPPDPPEPPVAERTITPVTDYTAFRMDFDENRRVDFKDFLKVTASFGARDFRYDFDRDGFVGFRDLLYFRYFFNQRVSTSITFRTPAFDQHVFEPVTTGDIVYKNSETGLFERAHADNILIGKYEVTNAQYFRYWDNVNRAADRTPLAIDGVIFTDYQEANPTLPVVRVDYASAQAYCEWIGGRLPTWSEWVIAANGEEDRLYAHGNDISPADANYFDSGDPFEPGPSPVGYYNGESDGFTTNDSFSKYGAYDMTGNVWEWVDRQRESFGIVEAVIMGGSFDDDQFGSSLFSQVFHWEEVDARRVNIGFRCARAR